MFPFPILFWLRFVLNRYAIDVLDFFLQEFNMNNFRFNTIFHEHCIIVMPDKFMYDSKCVVMLDKFMYDSTCVVMPDKFMCDSTCVGCRGKIWYLQKHFLRSLSSHLSHDLLPMTCAQECNPFSRLLTISGFLA